VKRIRIMVVEDESIVAKDIQSCLAHLGYSVPATAASGAEALVKARQVRPHLALVDIRLKGDMDGIVLGQELRERLHVPVVYLTAYSDDATIERAKKTEPFGYLLKPFEERELQTAIELALYKSHMEARLRESEQWLAATLRCIGDGVMATDDKGSVRFMNPVAEAITGWREPEALGKPVSEVFRTVDELTRAPLQTPFYRAIREGFEPDPAAEKLLLSAAGTETVIEETAAPIRGLAGEVLGAVLAFRDVSERRWAVEQLRASEERHRDLFENANDIIYTTDLQGRLLSVNRAAERLIGYTRQELLGMDIFQVLAPEYHQPAREFLYRGLGGEGPAALELEIIARDGRRMCLEASMRLQFANGRPSGVHAVARDITERRQAQQALARQAQELARSNADLEQFASVVSHDLQEPLRMVTSYAELIAGRCRGKLDADAEEFLGYVLNGAARMRRLIQDLLAYSRVSTRRHEFQLTDSGAVLHSVLTTLGARIEETGAVVTYGQLPTVLADEVQLGQLFQNLLSNALKFRSRDSPRIHLSAVREGPEWSYSVRDNGIGIEAREHERIFGIFERARSAGSYSGTGIGLAICRRIVERHGGRIWVESKPGVGSTFFFTIPAGGAESPVG